MMYLGICQSMGVSFGKGEPFLDQKGEHKNKACLSKSFSPHLQVVDGTGGQVVDAVLLKEDGGEALTQMVNDDLLVEVGQDPSPNLPKENEKKKDRVCEDHSRAVLAETAEARYGH